MRNHKTQAASADIKDKSTDLASVSWFTWLLKYTNTMRAVFLLLLVATAILAETNAQDEPSMDCGPNADFNDCVSACEPSCDIPSPQICTDECIRGCRCRKGFLLNNNNECVSSSSC